MASLDSLPVRIYQIGEREVKKAPFFYVSVLIVFLAAALLRVWNVQDILGFWYDQGRDALVIWDIIKKGKLTLIGPTTGIEGIFLGPFYYYLLTPAYFVGGGNPVIPAVFLGLLNAIGVLLIFILGRLFFGYWAGLLSAVLLAFSYNMVVSSRWLSNPAPLPVFVVAALIALYGFLKGRRWLLPIYSLMIALSLQLEAAVAVFFIPTTIVIWLVFKPKVEKKIFLSSVGLFLLTLSAQVVFDLRHDFLITKALFKFLTNGSFGLDFSQLPSLLTKRFLFYLETLDGYLFLNKSVTAVALFLFVIWVLIFRRYLFKLEGFKLTLIWVLVPLFFLSFYYGNFGYVWSYYILGILPATLLLIACFWQYLIEKGLGVFLVAIFLGVFLFTNWANLRSYLKTGIGVTLGEELGAVDFIYQDAQVNRIDRFNVDVYVPPVISYAYDYLFLWYGGSKYGFSPDKEMTKTLYLIWEDDWTNPQRLTDWFARMNGISRPVGVVQNYGDVHVQRRERL